jgi:DNA (cytosine-5)-methyltransferase 1
MLSLFSGAGGFDLGLELAGFSTRGMVEIERHACETLRSNRHKAVEISPGYRYLQDARIVERDIRKVTGTEVLRVARLEPGQAVLLAGGPPCVTFSVAGRREGLGAETGLLFEEYARILRVARPRWLLFENVKGLLNAVDEQGRSGGAFDAILDALCDAGYSLHWRLVNAADYGVPQQRERLIIIGHRGPEPPNFPASTHYDPLRPPQLHPPQMQPWRDVRSAISDLPRTVPQGNEPLAPNHVARAHGDAVIEGFKATPQGMRNASYKRDRLRWDRPSKVIRAQGKQKPDGSGQRHSSHQPIHPDEHRQLTVRECARIQTFPDWYELPGTFANGYRVVGDAVPPRLAYVLGRSVLEQAVGAGEWVPDDEQQPLAEAG